MFAEFGITSSLIVSLVFCVNPVKQVTFFTKYEDNSVSAVFGTVLRLKLLFVGLDPIIISSNNNSSEYADPI